MGGGLSDLGTSRGTGRVGGAPAEGLSTLLAELARTPSRDVGEAWERGLRPGDVVGRFELGRELGRGGFGVVYEARDRELNRSVAFKVIRPGKREQEPVRAELLRREAEAVAQLAHPNIVTLFDAGRSDSGPYLVLELLDGEPLEQRMERGPMAPSDAIRIGLGIARALVHAHDRGVLHRDLKPGNVFLCAGGEPKVLDFGLAHVFGLESPRGAGTPGYMAPEQRRGEEEDARADVWAAGVLLWEMVSGRRLAEQDFVDGGGVPPRLSGPGVPSALAELVARCLAFDPAARPRDAGELRDALERIARRAGRAPLLRRLAVAAVGVVAVAGAMGWYLGVRRVPVGAEAVAIADARNETGNARLDGVARMLLASLEQSRRLAVVPRERLQVLRDAAGFPASAPLRGEGARAAAQRAGARLLLELVVTPAAGGFALDLQGVDPLRGAVRFDLAERAPDEGAVPAAVDRLSRRVRGELGERTTPGAGELQVATALTADLEAYRHYFLGEQCAARPIYGQDCSPHFRRAAERDPSFAVAHYQLALWGFWYGAPLAEQLAAIDRAVAHAGAASEKDRLLIRGWDAWLHGRDDEALAAFKVVTERWPQDRAGWYQSGEILRRREELAAAIPWFEQAVAVDPEYGWALSHLVVCLGATGRRDDLARWVDRWEGSARPAELHALVLARGWLGDLRGAAAAAARATAMGGGVAAQEDVLAVWAFSGRYGAVEEAVRRLAGPGSEVRPMGFYALAAMDAYRGRRRSGEATLDRLRATLPGIERQALFHSARIEYRLGDRDPASVAPLVEELRALEPRAAAEHAAELAWLGDLPRAEALASALRPGSVLRRTHDAVARFRRGEPEAGLAALRAVVLDAPIVTWRVAPVYLLGELAAEAGRCEEAVDALRRFQGAYQPITMWRSWALPRSRLLVATCEAKLGRPDRARAQLDRLLADWDRPDPGSRLRREADALRVRLTAADR